MPAFSARAVVARTGKIDGRAIGLHGVGRSAKLDEAAAELAKGGCRSRVGTVDGCLAEGGAGVGVVARLEQGVAQAQSRP